MRRTTSLAAALIGVLALSATVHGVDDGEHVQLANDFGPVHCVRIHYEGLTASPYGALKGELTEAVRAGWLDVDLVDCPVGDQREEEGLAAMASDVADQVFRSRLFLLTYYDEPGPTILDLIDVTTSSDCDGLVKIVSASMTTLGDKREGSDQRRFLGAIIDAAAWRHMALGCDW